MASDEDKPLGARVRDVDAHRAQVHVAEKECEERGHRREHEKRTNVRRMKLDATYYSALAVRSALDAICCCCRSAHIPVKS